MSQNIKTDNLKRKQKELYGLIARQGMLCAALTLIYIIAHMNGQLAAQLQVLRVFGDALVISAVLAIEYTGILWLDKRGYIDWVSYSIKLSAYLLKRNKKDEDFTSYSDYKMLRERSVLPLWPRFIVSLIWLILGVLLSILYVMNSI